MANAEFLSTEYDDMVRPHIVIEYDITPPARNEGGFVNKKSGIVYKNASTQTIPKSRANQATKATRDAQTIHYTTHSSQTRRETGTQMPKPGVAIFEDGDRIMIPQEYFTADQWEALLQETALKIQRWTRGYLARKRLKEMKEEEKQRKLEVVQKSTVQSKEEDVQKIREMERRTHPTTKADFDILYAELQAWMQQETERINSLGLSEEERLAALAVLLSHETRIIQTIDRMKLDAKQENKEYKINSMLEKMSQPKEIRLRDNKDGAQLAQIHTPSTTRARELADLYKALKLTGLTIDERLDILLLVKNTIKEFDCMLTRELVDLIDREGDLLNRGRPEKTLKGLRERICQLFLQFIETPEFNPEAERFLKVPKDVMIRPNTKIFGQQHAQTSQKTTERKKAQPRIVKQATPQQRKTPARQAKKEREEAREGQGDEEYAEERKVAERSVAPTVQDSQTGTEAETADAGTGEEGTNTQQEETRPAQEQEDAGTGEEGTQVEQGEGEADGESGTLPEKADIVFFSDEWENKEIQQTGNEFVAHQPESEMVKEEDIVKFEQGELDEIVKQHAEEKEAADKEADEIAQAKAERQEKGEGEFQSFEEPADEGEQTQQEEEGAETRQEEGGMEEVDELAEVDENEAEEEKGDEDGKREQSRSGSSQEYPLDPDKPEIVFFTDEWNHEEILVTGEGFVTANAENEMVNEEEVMMFDDEDLDNIMAQQAAEKVAEEKEQKEIEQIKEERRQRGEGEFQTFEEAAEAEDEDEGETHEEGDAVHEEDAIQEEDEGGIDEVGEVDEGEDWGEEGED
ncbi:putative flagellar associated protein [Blattamonas nauphoetae]|uniref:Flagellar associated protein n=1 Tax=Blattamonas nauphoetae TaxID=2049346 RepID=A0ABQ9XWZ4_9EUKA|nr:putative flagellar associated protein [Blattamonas nauphoetae]